MKLAVTRARATGAPAVFWLDEQPRPRRPAHREGARRTCAEHDTDGPDHRDHGAGRGHRVLARAHPPRRGHHLGHRQRAARLPHRPVPDPRARHQRQDALDRAADERRRPVRDRRRRLGAEARAAVRQGEPPALGLARRVPRPGRLARAPRRQPATTPGPSCWPTPSTRPPARCSTRASRRRARSARSTTAAATSTSPCTGPRSWPRRPTTPSSRPCSPRSPRRSRSNEATIVAELNGVQGEPGRHRRLLLPRPDQGVGRHAPERHAQRHHRRSGRLGLRPGTTMAEPLASCFAPDLLAGRSALVTGGATGIGKEICRVLGQHGARVTMVSRKEENLVAARAPSSQAEGIDVPLRRRRRARRRGGGRVVAAAIEAFGRARHRGQQRGGQLPGADHRAVAQRLQGRRRHRPARHLQRHQGGLRGVAAASTAATSSTSRRRSR